MKPSVSVLLPVFNGQHRLEKQVAGMLELLAELADRFEVLIIDDGSTDDTTEVAQQLATLYPQVRSVRHPLRLGIAEVVQTGLDMTDGEVVLVGDEQHGIRPDDLRELWSLVDQRGWVLARRPAPVNPNAPWLEKLLSWTSRRGKNVAGVQLIRRREIEALQAATPAAAGPQRRIDSTTAPAAGDTPGRPVYLRNAGPVRKTGLGPNDRRPPH